MSDSPTLILASTSVYRRELLQRLRREFSCAAPGVDEQLLEHESPLSLAVRLAAAKARAVAARFPDAIVIGSDQAADLAGTALGKPGSVEIAIAQLAACSGRAVEFHTAVCVIDPRGRREHAFVDRTVVQFRTLRADEIERYVAAERPLDCAGSFKCEGLGAALFEHIRSEDPTALIGLPLIALARALRACGVQLP